jgi:hypothetical protein
VLGVKERMRLEREREREKRDGKKINSKERAQFVNGSALAQMHHML